MNGHDPFEQRLSRQPVKPIPPAWRGEILEAAAQAAATRHVTRPTQYAPWWRELFWPCPQAWAALAAAWVVILALNGAVHETVPADLARRGAAPSPQLRELLKQQEQLFAELVGPIQTSEADRRRPVAPSPRSSRREEFANA